MKLDLNTSYLERKAKYFPNVSEEEWNDWKWQVRNRIESVDELKKYIPLTKEEEDGVARCLETVRALK